MDRRQSQHDGETYIENVQADDPLTHPAAQSCPRVGLLDTAVVAPASQSHLGHFVKSCIAQAPAPWALSWRTLPVEYIGAGVCGAPRRYCSFVAVIHM